MAWNSTYENSPRNTNNPGYGAQAIRELKTDIRQKLQSNIIYGDSTLSGVDMLLAEGTPREGSARVGVTDGDESNRTDIIDSPVALVGQIDVNLETLTGASVRTRNDIDLPLAADQLVKKIRVTRFDSVVDVFDYDSMVDIKQDQTIDGRKGFTLPPLTPDLRILGDVKPDWREYITRNENLTAAVNVQETQVALDAAKFHNLFDSSGVAGTNSGKDNFAEGLIGNSADMPSGGTDYVMKNIRCDTISALNVYGATWNA